MLTNICVCITAFFFPLNAQKQTRLEFSRRKHKSCPYFSNATEWTEWKWLLCNHFGILYTCISLHKGDSKLFSLILACDVKLLPSLFFIFIRDNVCHTTYEMIVNAISLSSMYLSSSLFSSWPMNVGKWTLGPPGPVLLFSAHNNGCCTIYRISCALKQKSERTPLNSFFPLQTFCGKVLRAFRDDGSAARPRLDTSLSQSIPLQVTVFDVALKVLI